MADSGNKNRKFEAHITYDGKDRLIVEECSRVDDGWSYSEICGDPVLPGKQARCYLTSYGDDYDELFAKMNQKIVHVEATPVRMKIEFIVYDTAHGGVNRRKGVAL